MANKVGEVTKDKDTEEEEVDIKDKAKMDLKRTPEDLKDRQVQWTL